MAQSSDTSKKNCPSAILNTIPDKYDKLPFTQLKSLENFEDKAIVGKICHLNPIGKRVNGFVRKLLITDGLEKQQDDQKKLTVFLLDQFAQDSEAAEVEGYVAIANFIVEKSTHQRENEFLYQILVKNPESQVWFGRKKVPQNSTDQIKVKKSKKIKEENDQVPKILSNHYEYASLGELQETGSQKYNVYGIVEKCDLKVTQGNRKQILDLWLTDSTDKTEIGFPCSIYCAQDENFPDVYPGDAVRIHRMLVYKFRSKLRGKCLSSKFILVFSKSNGGTKPKTVAKSFTFTPEDAKTVKDLFEWYDIKNQPKLFSEIEKDEYVNIICQVIGVYIAKHKDVVVLKVWDGTKSNLIESSHLGLRDEKLDEKLFSVAKKYYINLSVYGNHCSSAGELKPGQFIEVRNAQVYSPKDNPDEYKLTLFPGNNEKRGVKVVNLDDNRLTELKERLEKIVAEEQEFGNHTEDVLSQNNSIFINCDISALMPSQICANEEDSATADVLNNPLPSTNGAREQTEKLNVVSAVDAAVRPGQSTQEFGEILQKDYQFVSSTQEHEFDSFEPDPFLNKTPLDFKMLLHNPSSQAVTNHEPPFTYDTPEEWYNSLPTISVTDGHSSVKPSSLAEVVNHEVPYKFRVLCIANSFKPKIRSIQQLIHLYCPDCYFLTDDLHPSFEPYQEQDAIMYYYCPECFLKRDQQNRSVLKYTYLFSLDLYDGSIPSDLEVRVFEEHSIKFFKGISPEEVLRKSELAESLLHMFWNVCPNCQPLESTGTLTNNYPLLDCCILSYTNSNNVHYQMFDTILK